MRNARRILPSSSSSSSSSLLLALLLLLLSSLSLASALPSDALLQPRHPTSDLSTTDAPALVRREWFPILDLAWQEDESPAQFLQTPGVLPAGKYYILYACDRAHQLLSLIVQPIGHSPLKLETVGTSTEGEIEFVVPREAVVRFEFQWKTVDLTYLMPMLGPSTVGQMQLLGSQPLAS